VKLKKALTNTPAFQMLIWSSHLPLSCRDWRWGRRSLRCIIPPDKDTCV